MGEYDEQSFWGNEFHLLPFVSIFGASAAGAIGSTVAMARDGVPAGYAAVFLGIWALLTVALIVAANRFFDRPDMEHATTGSFINRIGSGTLCAVVSLAAVFATYKTVDALAVSPEAAVAVHAPDVKSAPATASKSRALPKESVHFRRTDLLPGQVARLPEKLPAPIAPPEQELVSLPLPAADAPDGELKILADGDSVSLSDEAADAEKPKAARAAKKPKRRKVKTRKIKRTVVRNAKVQSGGTAPKVDGASAPPPNRKIRGLTTESGSSTSGKSAACSSGHRSLANSACRELGAFSR
ncbi:MAG: hypothetical protein AAF441_03045 [Pseudomonadota bacterium]